MKFSRRDFLKISGSTIAAANVCNLCGCFVDDGTYTTGTCNNEVIGVPVDTRPVQKNTLTIQDIGVFEFDPLKIQSLRPEFFRTGYFSLFDILVHLSNEGKISLSYHFDEEMDTHIIDDLNGSAYWWYEKWYEGGWPERSVHRMDYYPVKDYMHISFAHNAESSESNNNLNNTFIPMEDRYQTWKTEVERRKENNGKIVIPEVEIILRDGSKLLFENVEPVPHNLRSDMLVEGTITAADVILTLGDREDLDYELLWYETINGNRVKNYYVECINDHRHSHCCGFTYEVGERGEDTIANDNAPVWMQGMQWGNHIHLQTDLRILHSPQYVLFIWSTLGSCLG